jgi:hypothetical protein
VNEQEIDHVRRLREALDALADEAAPGNNCPEADRLWDASRGELPSHEAEAVVDHVAACRACARAWQLAVDLGNELPARATAAIDAAAAPPYWTVARLAPAFVGAIAVMITGTIAFQLLRGAPTAPSPEPTADAPTRQFIEPDSAVDIIGPDGVVAEAPTEFEWVTVDGADIYQVRIYAEDGTLVWTSDDLAGTSVAWPDTVTLGATPYYWGVTALADGEIVAESGLPSDLTP